MRIAYLTDIKGQWHKLQDFAAGNPCVQLQGERLSLQDDAIFVFGGDVIDRGPHARRLMRTFIAAKTEYQERIVLLAGNRDINKLRLWRELQGQIPYPVPAAIRALPRPELLRWLFHHTMNTPRGMEHREEELSTRDGDAVVASFIEDVKPGGLHVNYLSHCQLGFRYRDNLFVHGAITDDNLFITPEHPPATDVDVWLATLNAWYRQKMELYVTHAEKHTPAAEWAALIAYQAPIFPTRLNPGSVVYSRHADEAGNPLLPSQHLQQRLQEQGIRRVVVGHTPSGDVPALLRSGRFQWLLCDNSYSPLERGTRVIIDADRLAVHGYALVDGSTVEVNFALHDQDLDSPLGLRVPASRYLVKSPLGEAWLLGRHLPQFKVDQVSVHELPQLEEARAD